MNQGPPSIGGGGYRDNRAPSPPSYRNNDRAPSPPMSNARSSDGTGLYTDSGYSSIKGRPLEEELSVHHGVFKRLLVQELLNERSGLGQKRAREKLLRLSIVQFQELSTDIYDEFLRRQSVNDRRDSGQSAEAAPAYLLPTDDFHPKRNQARIRLSTLPVQRFKILAKDVFYELERRYPQFAIDNGGIGDRDAPGSPTGSMASSIRSFPAPPGRMNSPGPGRIGSPGPGRIGSPGPNGSRNGPPPQGYNPMHSNQMNQIRAGMPIPPQSPGLQGPQGPQSFPGPQGPPAPGLGGPGPGPGPGPGGNQFGRPLPKTFQSNTIVPVKSTMVEEDDDDAGEEDDGYEAGDHDDREMRDTLPNMPPSGSSEGPIGGARRPSTSSKRSRAGSVRSVNGSIKGGGPVMGGNTNGGNIGGGNTSGGSLSENEVSMEMMIRYMPRHTG